MSSKKVYLVTSGEYSDYCVLSVYSSRERAQAWIDEALKSEHSTSFMQLQYSIETHSLDPPVVFGYTISLVMARDGTVTNIRTPAWVEHPTEEVHKVALPGRGLDYNLRRFTVPADSNAAAIEKAHELRLLMIALDEWPE